MDFLHPSAVLELLAVHPDYQRLGAGKALVQWGTKAADEQGLQVVLSPISSFFLHIPNRWILNQRHAKDFLDVLSLVGD